MKKMSQWTVWMCALAFACAAGGDIIRVGDGGGNPDFVYGTWPAGSVVELVGPVVVGNGTSLTIGEGTVVKAEQGASLYVQGGGTLTAQGTADAPVRFTAAYTYRALGDDGTSGLWEGVNVAGTADFVHSELLYGGSETQGLLTVRSGGVVRMDRSLVAHSTGVGIWNSGELWVTNSAIYDTVVAGVYLDTPGAKGVSRAQFTHCVFDRCELGVHQGGGDGVFANCDISDYRTYGATYIDGVVSFDRCNFYSERGIMVTASPLEANRRLEVAPLFVDPENYDFRLKQGSELIDAGDAVEGATEDAFGNGRANASLLPATGTADAGGKYPDIGLHEFQPTYTDEDVDIFAWEVHVEPTEAKPGDTLTVTWMLVNAGSNAFSGTWKDAVSLVPRYGTEVALGEVEHTGTIAGGEELECSATFVLPPVADRKWEVKVVADADGGVFEKLGAEHANENYSVETLTTQADVWDVGSAMNVEIPAGAERVYAVTGLETNGQSLKVSGAGTDWAAAGAYHGIPTAAYSWKSTKAGDGAVWLWAPGAASNTVAYLVLRNDGAGSAALLLQGGGTGMQVLATDRAEVTISTNTSVTADGVGLAAGVTGILEKDGTEERYEAVLGGTGAVRRYAIFDLHEATAGAYRFGISDGTATAWLDGTITVKVAETGAVLRTSTMMPVQFHADVPYEGFVYYVNEGDADMWLPEFSVLAGAEGGTMLAASRDGPFNSGSLHLQGFSPTEPTCVLKAGESGQVSFFYRAPQGVNLQVMTEKERSPEAYQEMQNAQDEARQQADAQAEKDSAVENKELKTGNPSLLSGRIEGRLLMTGTEEPVAGVELKLRGTLGRNFAGSLIEGVMSMMRWDVLGRTTTGPDGSFVFEGLPVGSSFLFASDEVGLETADELSFADMDNPVLQDCVVHVEEVYHQLTGQVTGDGTPLAGVSVWLKSKTGRQETETDSAGHWSFRNLREGGYEVQAQASQGFVRSATEEVELLADTEVTLELTRGGVVHAVAKDAATGEPIPELNVMAYDLAQDEVAGWAMSDEEGNLEFPGLPPGSYFFDTENGQWDRAGEPEALAVTADSEQTIELEFSESCFFSVWPFVGEYPMRVMIDYYDESRIPEDVEKWEWDFDGDGVIDSTNRNARFTYETNGIYDVVLKATMAGGTTNEYRLREGVEVLEHVETVLQDNVIILTATNTDYLFVSSVAGETNHQLVVSQLVDNPSQSIGPGTVFMIDSEFNHAPPVVKVVSVTQEGDVWRMVTEEVMDFRDIFSSFQLVPRVELPDEEEVGPSPQRRGLPDVHIDDNTVGIDYNLWKSKDGNARVDANLSTTSEKDFNVVLRWSEAMKGIHFHLAWKRSFVFGLHFQVHTNAKDTAHWDTEFLSDEVNIPIAVEGLTSSGIYFNAKLKNTLNLDLSWDVGTEIDSWPEFRWTPEVRIIRLPAFGAAEGGWSKKIYGEPKIVFRDGKNKWELNGNVKGSAVVRSEASLSFSVKAFGKWDVVNIMRGAAWFQVGTTLTGDLGAMKFDLGFERDYGAELDFLTFKGTVLDDWFEVKWSALHFPLAGGEPFTWPSLSWPFGSGDGAFRWPNPLLPDLNINLGSLFGWVPKFSWPGFPPDFSGWKPTFPKFDWHCGAWPLQFPTFDFRDFDKSDWEFDLNLGSLKIPKLDFSFGMDLKAILANMPNLKIQFSKMGFDFHFPEVDFGDFDFNAPVICLPQFSIPFKPALRRFMLPNLRKSLPKWTGLGPEWLNLPAEIYLDWGDGEPPYTLDMSGKSGKWDVEQELNRLLSHEYPGPGIYQAELGVRLRFFNEANKHLKFTVVVLNQDVDGDGMPNMWETLYQGDAEEGTEGLNPFDPSDGGRDFDNDGLTSLQEFLAGTHPLEADHDGDEMPDGFEVMYMKPPKGKNYSGLNPWKADANKDADGDGMKNGEEYKYEKSGGDYGVPTPYDTYNSTNPWDEDTDDGGMEDGEEYKSKGTDKEKNAFDPIDDPGDCKCCEELKWDEGEKKYKCERIEDCQAEKAPEPTPPCASWVRDGKDEKGCPKWKLEPKKDCPKKNDPPPTNYPLNCKDLEKALCKYCAACKDGIVQWALSHVTITIKVDCDPKYPSSLSGVIAALSGVGSGSSGIGGGGGGGGWGGGGTSHPCGETKRPPDPGPPTPNGNSPNGPGKSAVYLPMGDYIDDSLDLPLRMGGTTAGVARQLQDNEWTFWEAASRLELAPGTGAEGEVSVGTGSLGVEWNGSGAPGAVAGLTNGATGVSLSSVPTGLWGPWAGTTQALIRVEYGVLRGNGTVATNYGELVKAWRAAVEGGDTGKAADLEAAAMAGMVRVTAAEDAEGRRTSYEWNGFGQMTVAHFADGTQESYEYGSGGMMSGKAKRDGEHVGLVHDNFGYLTGLNDYKYEYTYDAGTKTFYAAIRYPDGRVGERWFDEDGKIFRHAMNGGLVYDKETVKAEALLAAKPAWPKETRNDAELPVTVEYRSGASEVFTWDGPGYARTSATEATGEERSWTYDDAGREMSETREGVVVSVERDEAGYVTRDRLDSASGTAEAEWTWDAAGNASVGRMGDWARTNTYDLAGRVLTATAADGGTWAFTRDAEGRTTEWTQPDGTSGSKVYDGRGRMTWRRSPGGVETWWSHATNGLLSGWSNSLGRKVSYQYDLGERVAKATDEAGDMTTYAYDGAGNWRGVAPELRMFVNDGEGGLVLGVTNGGRVTTAHRLWGTWLLRDVQANDQSWRLERNDEGQVTGLIRVPVSGTAVTNRWTYDAAGRLAGWTDATDVSMSRGYDAAGFVVWETNGAGGVRRWSHDGTGHLTSVTDAAGRTSVFDYDPASGTTTATLADGSELDLQFDAWGREIVRTDAAETAIAAERRFDGAVLRKTWTAAGAASAGLEATWTRDGDGRLVRQGMMGGLSTRFERTGSNRCERTVTEYGAFEAGTAVERDAAGRLSAVAGPDGARAECVYGDDGEVSGWLLPEGSIWFARNLMDRMRTMMLPSGQLVTERADLSGRMTNVVLTGMDGTVVWSLALARDAAGRIVRQGSETLEWDGAERVVSAGGTAYSRDAAGNRSGSGWTTEGMDRLTAWPGGTYGYDSNGAVVSRTSGASELRFVRDLAGRVTEVRDGSDGLVARFSYDAEGRRLSKEAGDGTLTWYLWCGDRLAAELSGEGTVERVYGYWTEEARTPDWVRTGGELYVVLKDGFGAPAALVSASDGTVTEATAGSVFGEGWACAAMPVWADGLIADAETGLMAGPDGRLYDPATGRWLSPTRGALEAGLNLYAWEPSSKGVGREFPGLSMPGVSPEYDVMYAFARRCGEDAATAAALARAELLLGLEGRSDAAARRWVRLRDEATTAAGLRLLGGVPAGQVVCARKGVESFLKARRDVLAVTDELDAYGKLRSAMDLEEAFRLELAWSGLPEDRASMGAWRGTWGWAGLRPEGPSATERWLTLLQQAGNGERLSEETLEWLGEAKLLALSDWVRPVTASLDAEKMRETVGEDMTELRQVLQMWVKECK